MNTSGNPFPLLEICCGDVASLLEARAGGADRVEVCAALEVGGVTPSFGAMMMASKIFPEGAHILIRPRSGDFVYDSYELAQMASDIVIARTAGATGVVVGALTPDGDVDMEAMSLLRIAAKDMHLTFHRAFDLCCDPQKALEDIISVGCRRVLSSGLATTALEGAETLRKLHDQANGRIEIMAGGGINATNAARVAWLTEADAIHASAKTALKSNMKFRRDNVNMGVGGVDEYSRSTTSGEMVAHIKSALTSNN